MTKRTKPEQAMLPEVSNPGTPGGALRFEIVAVPGKVDDTSPFWEMKARLHGHYRARHLEASDLIGKSVRVRVIGAEHYIGAKVMSVRSKLDADGAIVVDVLTTGDVESPALLGRQVAIELAQDVLPGVREAFERLRPQPGSGISSVTMSVGGESITLHASDADTDETHQEPSKVSRGRKKDRATRTGTETCGRCGAAISGTHPDAMGAHGRHAHADSGTCRECGCTDSKPCEPPCAWTDATETLCTSCIPNDSELPERKPAAKAKKRGGRKTRKG